MTKKATAISPRKSDDDSTRFHELKSQTQTTKFPTIHEAASGSHQNCMEKFFGMSFSSKTNA